VIDSMGAKLLWPKIVFEIESNKMALLHGEETAVAEILARCGELELVAYGHSHQASVRKFGSTILVNPGETCGYLCGKATVALVDLETQEAKVVELRW